MMTPPSAIEYMTSLLSYQMSKVGGDRACHSLRALCQKKVSSWNHATFLLGGLRAQWSDLATCDTVNLVYQINEWLLDIQSNHSTLHFTFFVSPANLSIRRMSLAPSSSIWSNHPVPMLLMHDLTPFRRAVEVICTTVPRLKAEGRVDKLRALSYM